MANQYRCILSDNDRTAARMIIEADNDAAAVLQADNILEGTSCLSAEIWDRGRRVSIISRKSSAV
jgi:hypothetical protein